MWPFNDESYWAAISCGVVHYAGIQGGSNPFESVDEILFRDYSNVAKSYWAVKGDSRVWMKTKLKLTIATVKTFVLLQKVMFPTFQSVDKIKSVWTWNVNCRCLLSGNLMYVRSPYKGVVLTLQSLDEIISVTDVEMKAIHVFRCARI